MRPAYYRAWRARARMRCWLASKRDPAVLARYGFAAAPPPILRFRVSELAELEPFFTVGRDASKNIERCLAEAGTPLDTFRSILDFGCGCGRVTLWMARQMNAAAELCGTDTDADAIAWCRDHLPGRFTVNAPLPPLEYPDSAFDLIYAVSVFTHLDEERQFEWLDELRRVLKPGGTLLFTVHGEQVWKQAVHRSDQLDTLDRQGFLFARSAKMSGICPDWYHTAYHTREYVMTRIGALFDTTTYIAGGLGIQDAVVVRKQQ
jgi:ubiquinone/menaquinone biosynthesis C-methylase UbiE